MRSENEAGLNDAHTLNAFRLKNALQLSQDTASKLYLQYSMSIVQYRKRTVILYNCIHTVSNTSIRIIRT